MRTLCCFKTVASSLSWIGLVGWVIGNRTAELVHRDHLERAAHRGFPACPLIRSSWIMSTATVMELRPTRSTLGNEFDQFADTDGLVKLILSEVAITTLWRARRVAATKAALPIRLQRMAAEQRAVVIGLLGKHHLHEPGFVRMEGLGDAAESHFFPARTACHSVMTSAISTNSEWLKRLKKHSFAKKIRLFAKFAKVSAMKKTFMGVRLKTAA